jgi:hypothetical protein
MTCSSFFLSVIHEEGLCPSTEKINRLMMIMMIDSVHGAVSSRGYHKRRLKRANNLLPDDSMVAKRLIDTSDS